MLRAVVFDLDDTLYLERGYVLSGFRAVAEHCRQALGLPAAESFVQLVDLLDGGARGDTFDRFLVAHGIDPARETADMVRVYREHEPDIRPFPGVHELLRRLKTSYRLGLVTDGSAAAQRRKVIALGLVDLFDALVFSDEYGRDNWKPSRRPFEEVAAALEVAPWEAVYVGENCLKDFFGARATGMGTIRVRGGEGFYADIEPPSPAHAADREIYGLRELKAVLEEWPTDEEFQQSQRSVRREPRGRT